MEERFFFCNSCGNLMIAAIASGVVPFCCGEEMVQLKANTTDMGKEKHVPVVTCVSEHSAKVTVGTDPHPMTTQHYIRFVCLETTKGIIIRYLNPGDAPEVCIHFDGKPVAVYAYCNVHGLWRGTIPKECCPQGSQMYCG